jgi:hypothetical protein
MSCAAAECSGPAVALSPLARRVRGDNIRIPTADAVTITTAHRLLREWCDDILFPFFPDELKCAIAERAPVNR